MQPKPIANMKKTSTTTYSLSHKLLRGLMDVGLLRNQIGNNAVVLHVEGAKSCTQSHCALANQRVQQTQTVRQMKSLEVGERTIAIGLGGPHHWQWREKLQGLPQLAGVSRDLGSTP